MARPLEAIELRLLGGFAVRVGGCEVAQAAFERRKAQSLLKLLSLQKGYRLHRDQVLEALWPTLSPPAALSQLYKAVHQARAALASAGLGLPPEELLALKGEVLSLQAPGGVISDLEAFEAQARVALASGQITQLEQALASYDELLPADRYEDWTLERREALQELQVRLSLALGQARLTQGLLAEATEAFRTVLKLDPAHEEAHRGLMQIYALQGSRLQMDRQYHRCRQALAEELGVEPAPETEALYRRLLAAPLPPLAGEAPVPASPTWPLAGREEELSQMARALERLALGREVVLGLEGPPGIGKTRLAQEVLRLSRQRGYQTFLGTAHATEGQLPYAPFVEVLRQALRTNPADSELLPTELRAHIPELPAGGAPVLTGDPLAAQGLLFAAVWRFLSRRATDSPLVLVLEDLHNSDEGTLHLFHYLARQAVESPVLLLGTWRSEPKPPQALKQLIHSLEGLGLHSLSLKPLTQSAHRDLLVKLLGGEVAPVLEEELYRLSEGNPLFALEVTRQLQESGQLTRTDEGWHHTGLGSPPLPPSLATLVGGWLVRLSPEALHLLQLIAVAGQTVPLAVLEAAVGPRLADTLEEALTAHLLLEEGLGYRFRHVLYREALYQGLSLARRSILHGELARALEATYPSDPTPYTEALAYHYRQAGKTEQALGYLLKAGERATAVYDHAAALERYREALGLELSGETRAGIWERIGDAHRATGNVHQALAAYREALEATSSPAALYRKLALCAILATDMVSAKTYLHKAEAHLGDTPLERAQLLLVWALYHWHWHEFERAASEAHEVLNLAEAQGAQVEAQQACELLALSYLPLGRWEEGLHYELKRGLAGWSPEVALATDAHLCLWEYHVYGEDPYRQAQTFVHQVQEHAQAMGNLRCVAVCHYALGSMELLRANFHQAAHHLGRALELHQRIGSPAGEAYTRAREALLHTARGELEAGWQAVQQGLEAAQEAAVRDHCLARLYAAGLWNRLAAGDPGALHTLAEKSRSLEVSGAHCPVCSVQLFPALAAYHLCSGELETALNYARKATELAAAFQNQSGYAQARWMEGQVLAAQGRAEEAEVALAEAASIFRTLGHAIDLIPRLSDCLPSGTPFLMP
ncbi:ATP-binding protein [Thermus scotoductus]